MHIVIPHKFSKAQAVDRVKKGLIEAVPHMKGQVEIESQVWEGDTLSFAFIAQKQRVAGTLAVEDSQFILDAKLPLMWRLFEGKIERAIAEQVKALN